jgi:hypothetical protein
MELERKVITPEPTETEVGDWLFFTAYHSFRMEICLNVLGVGSRDPQRPHDIMGEGNKFEFEVIQGFSTENRPGIPHDQHVVASLTRHRMQHHHLKWNDKKSGATDEEMMVGAIDAVCSLLEDRPYQGGAHTFDEIRDIIETRNPLYLRHWMTEALNQIQKLQLPDINQFFLLNHVPNFSLPRATHEAIRERVHETIVILERDHGYKNIRLPR